MINSNKTKITFYDVEHGSCCHIITPNNKHILVDVGSKSNSSIVDYIKKKYFYGNDGKIDQLIITHPHEDHIFDLPNLYYKLQPTVLRRPTNAFDIVPSKDTPLHKSIADCANMMNRTYNLPLPSIMSPTEESNNGGVKFKFIDPKDDWTNKDDMNTFSCIIIVLYEGYKFVLTGDNPAPILRKMMELNYMNIKNEIANATVLLAPHHGRVNEFCKEFFDCVNPYLTVVSDKSIVHDTQNETSQLYKGRGANLNGEQRYVLTTRNDGTISFDITENNCIVNMGLEEY